MNQDTLSLKFRVTKADIKEGIGHNCTECPIASAINRTLAGMGLKRCYAYVDPFSSMWHDAEGIVIRDSYSHDDLYIATEDDLDHEIESWVMNFDRWDERRTSGEHWRTYEKRTRETSIKPWPIEFEITLNRCRQGEAES